MAELPETLNYLAGTTKLDAQAAANAWAGTTGLDLVGALNAKAGTRGLELNGVLKLLADQEDGNPAADGPGALGVLVPVSTPVAEVDFNLDADFNFADYRFNHG